MINVMIAEDNKDLNELLFNIVQKDKEIKVISRNYDGYTTIQDYRKLKPDVLILDLEISRLNGIKVLDSLCLDTKEKKICNVILISDNDSYRLNITNVSKVYKILPKPCNFDLLVNTIKEIRLYS